MIFLHSIRMIIGSFILAILFCSCHDGSITKSKSEKKKSVSKCSELVSVEEMEALIEKIDLTEFKEFDYNEKDLCIEIIAVLGDQGFYRKINKSTLCVILSEAKGDNTGKDQNECLLIRDIDRPPVDINNIYILYFKENLMIDNKIDSLRPFRCVKIKSK
jgi:hypothetical protein